MADDLSKGQLQPAHPDRKTGYERILTDPAPPWFVELYPGGDGKGFFEKLERHSVSFHERSSEVLIISFDNISVVNDLSFAREPWGWKYFRDQNWSHMGVFARSKAWFRDQEIITYLEEKSKSGFFERFDRVVMTGSSMGGFAAIAFAPLVQRATVLAFNPQSTLDERLVPWEGRYGFGQVHDWDLPYSDAANSLETIEQLYVLYDPFFEPDRKHAMRLASPRTLFLKTWYANHFVAPLLSKLGMLKPVMSGVVHGSLTEAEYYRLLRARRTLPMFIRQLEGCGKEKHPQLVRNARLRFRRLRRMQARQAQGNTEDTGS